jgi:hypothetical protein
MSAPAPSAPRPREELLYTIEEWSADNTRLIEVLARIHLMPVAYAAFEATAAARPKSRIILRKQAWELATSRP